MHKASLLIMSRFSTSNKLRRKVMRKLMLIVPVVLVGGLLWGATGLQQKGGEDETGPYEVVPNWPQPLARSGYALGSQGGVFAESPNRVFLLNRGEIKLPDKLTND